MKIKANLKAGSQFDWPAYDESPLKTTSAFL
jgi:hypothetical protein